MRPTKRQRRKQYSAALYLEDLYCGGAEEGGWYYRAGVLINSGLNRMFSSERAALRYARHRLRAWCDEHNIGRPSITSVRSCGEYVWQVNAGAPVAHYPTRRPRYE